MLSATFAIARLHVRAAVSSGLFVALGAAVLVTSLGLPAVIHGDGTADGQARLMLAYTPGLVAILLGLATLWSSCGAMALEIRDRQIQMLVAKPVRRSALWLGKWLGLLAVNALLLALAGVALDAVVRWRTAPSRLTPAERQKVAGEVLVARTSLRPVTPDLATEAHRRLELLTRQGQIGPSVPHDEAIAELRRRLRAEATTVGPGRSRVWSFPALPTLRADTPVLLRHRLTPVARGPGPIGGEWSVGAADAAAPFYRFVVTNEISGVYLHPIPAAALRPGQPFVVRFVCAAGPDGGTAVFDFDRPVELLVGADGFEANLARSLLVIFCRLALLAALGLTAGCLFSFPVAAFASACLLSIALLARVFASDALLEGGCGHDHGGTATTPALEAFASAVSRQVNRLAVPFVQAEAFARLSDGVRVPWTIVGHAAVWMLGWYPLVLGGLATAVLARRELALPSANDG